MKKSQKSFRLKAVSDCVRRLIRLHYVIRHHSEIYDALQASWYAMIKHAEEECSREIEKNNRILKGMDFKPNDPEMRAGSKGGSSKNES